MQLTVPWMERMEETQVRKQANYEELIEDSHRGACLSIRLYGVYPGLGYSPLGITGLE